MTDKSSNTVLNSDSTFQQAQTDMCKAYANGSAGTVVSGLVWLCAAAVSHQLSHTQAMWTLIIGGTLIHPLSLVLCKVMGLSGQHSKGNPLANLGMEGTIFMILCIPIAFGLSLQHTEWFFQAMLLIIGGRYLTFSSIYGIKMYWLLGAALALAAYLLFSTRAGSFITLLTGSAIEISFGILVFLSYRGTNKGIWADS